MDSKIIIILLNCCILGLVLTHKWTHGWITLWLTTLNLIDRSNQLCHRWTHRWLYITWSSFESNFGLLSLFLWIRFCLWLASNNCTGKDLFVEVFFFFFPSHLIDFGGFAKGPSCLLIPAGRCGSRPILKRVTKCTQVFISEP